MKTAVVIPAYNEAAVISAVVSSVLSKVSLVVVIDDGSSDQTGYLAKKAGAIVLTHLINRGQGAALQTGILYALQQGADIIVTFDADGQLVATEIDLVISPLLLGKVDVVLGSRFLKHAGNIPVRKKILLKVAVIITKLYTGLSISDTHNAFRAFSKSAANQLNITQRGMAHASEILEQVKKYNFKFIEVPVTINYTTYSQQKGQKISGSFKIIWDLLLSRLSR